MVISNHRCNRLQRYPEALDAEHILISFIRDPLAIAISLSRYRALYLKEDRVLGDDLLSTKNFLASFFSVNEDNFRRYLMHMISLEF